MRAFIAIVLAKSGVLIGGVRRHESSPFELREDAQRWADTILESNAQAGRHAEFGGIKQVMSSRARVVRAAQ